MVLTATIILVMMMADALVRILDSCERGDAMMKRPLKNSNGARARHRRHVVLALCALSYVWLPQPILEVHPEESLGTRVFQALARRRYVGARHPLLMIVGTRVMVAVSSALLSRCDPRVGARRLYRLRATPDLHCALADS